MKKNLLTLLFTLLCLSGSAKIYTFMHDGGWCWYQDPRAVISNGKLVIGGLDGTNGDVRIGVFDLKSKTIDGAVVLAPDFQRDDHDTPALYVRPDGSILAVWAKHGAEKIHHYKFSDKDDYLKWGKGYEFHHDYVNKLKNWGGVTYMNLFYLDDDKLLYNFFRDGLTYNPSFITSKDHGETWENRTHLIANDIVGRQRPYARYNQIDCNTIGIAYTDGHPRDYGNSLYYAEFRDGSFYKADGTKISDLKDGALRSSKGDLIYRGSELYTKPKECESVPNSAWSCATSKDSKGNPTLGYTLYLNNDDHRFRVATWTGEKWVDREIAYAGRCLYTKESSYTGLMTFDPTDPTRVYISTNVNPSTGEDLGGTEEIYYAKVGVKDDITTIKWKAITKNTDPSERNIRPMVVTGEGHTVLLWLKGPWAHFGNYDVNVVGKIID